MGLEVSAIVLGSIALAAEGGKVSSQASAAQARNEALDLQGKELQLKTQQKTLGNYDAMEKVVDAQIAHMTTTGAAFSSPSFNAIQRDTLNIGAKNQKNIDIEGDLEQANIDIEKRNVKKSLFSQLFGDAAETAFGAATIYSKMPKLED